MISRIVLVPVGREVVKLRASEKLSAASEPQGCLGKKVAGLALLRSSSPGQGLQHEPKRLQVVLPSLYYKGDEAQAHFIKERVACLSVFALALAIIHLCTACMAFFLPFFLFRSSGDEIICS